MIKRSVLALAPLALLALASVHCDGDVVLNDPGPADGGTGVSNDAGPDTGPSGTVDPPLVPASKVDLLFVVDNSNGMAAKQAIVANGLGKLLGGLAVADLHVGVITTALASGGDVCPAETVNGGRLRNTSDDGSVVAGAETGFLALGGAGGVADLATLEARTKEIIGGVGQRGCGLEAQLEAMYRFVADPMPPRSIVPDAFAQAKLEGTDYELLAQRKAFFRPDSAVAIVLVTDEDDGSLDARAVGGFGYAFGTRNFPSSQVRRGSAAQGTTAPRGTSVCSKSPLAADCSSCGFAASCDPQAESCQKLRADANCKASGQAGQSGPGYDGFYAADEDDFNVRLFDMRRRFGTEPRFPVGRYVVGLTGRKVPSRETEHREVEGADGRRQIAEYVQAETCTNPLFATNLPAKEGDELCQLGDNGRSSRLVTFGLIGGAPPDLLGATPSWTKLVGANPPADGSVSNDPGLDRRMMQSIGPREDVTGDWDTQKKDLQYACTFALAEPRTCTDADDYCECGDFALQPAPLCDGPKQVRGKAYPTFRELLLARDLGERSVVGSICDVDDAQSYGPFFTSLAAKISGGLAK